MLIGAAIQTVLVLVLPRRYAITPAIFLLAIHLIDAILVTKGLKRNPFLSRMIKGKTTAQVRSTDGTFAGPGQEKVAVLLLGAKSNHPLGFFAPDFATVGGYLDGMTKELEDPSTAEDTGCKYYHNLSFLILKTNSFFSPWPNWLHPQRCQRCH
jgi:hypothetical protein